MSIDSMAGHPDEEAARQHEAKMEGIRGNAGETRSEAEIRAQAEQELDQGIRVDK